MVKSAVFLVSRGLLTEAVSKHMEAVAPRGQVGDLEMARTGKTFSFEDGMIGPGVSALSRVFMFAQWAKIGVDHYNRAVAQPDPGLAFDDCLVAVVSAAFAIDSFVKDLPHTRPTKAAKKSCPIGPTGEGHLAFEVLNANYAVTAEQAATWHPELHTLFKLRSDAVHFQGEPVPNFKHSNGTFYHKLVGVYAPETAEKYLRIAHEIMDFAVKNPKPPNPDLLALLAKQLGNQITGFEAMPGAVA